MKTPLLLHCRILALLLLGGVGDLYAQTPAAADPAKFGLTQASLREIDAMMARYTAPDRFPGAVLMLARRDTIGYWKAFGVRDLETRAPLQPNDLFRIYSLTKPVTVSGLLMLHEEGRLGLEDAVAKYIPAFAKLRVFDGSPQGRAPIRPMTIRHLLTYTSGLTYGVFGNPSPADRLVVAANLDQVSQNLDDLMSRLAALPLRSDPGAAVSYGFQMDVAGKIIEAVSGQKLEAFLQQRILAPLGMRETSFTAPQAMLDRMPGLYCLEAGKPVTSAPATEWTGAYGAPPRVTWGGHGLVSTPADYLRFARMIAAGGALGGTRILQSTSVAMMTSAQVPLSLAGVRELAGAGWTYGFGTFVAMDPEATGARRPGGVFYHSGAANLFTWFDRDRDLIGLVWAQAVPYQVYPLFEDVRRAVAAAIDRATRLPKSAEQRWRQALDHPRPSAKSADHGLGFSNQLRLTAEMTNELRSPASNHTP